MQSNRVCFQGRRILSQICANRRCLYRGLSDSVPKEDLKEIKEQNKRKWLEEALLYVHWPYCQKKCTYCNFNKYVSDSVDHKRMRDCLVQETKSLIKLSEVKRIKSVFFGGGTPSLADPATIQSIIDSVKSVASLDGDAEITLEANPTSTEAAKMKDFKDAGINRLSLGIQSLNDEALRLLGRQHTADEALKALSMCKSLFPGRTSVDVIFGRPGQTLDGWTEELAKVQDLGVDHFALYQLTLERGTKLFKQIMDRDMNLPSNDIIADMYQHTVEVMETAGYSRYEVSNFAKNCSAESIHNKGYWSSTQYLGVGPGAHGRFVPQATDGTLREARVQALVPEVWMDGVEQSGHGTTRVVQQSTSDVLQEVLMLGMRSVNGIHQKDWELFTNVPLYHIFGETYITKMLTEEGYLHVDKQCIKATPKGLNVADGLTRELLNILHTFME